MFNEYPYTDFNKINLDWLLETVKKLAEQSQGEPGEGVPTGGTTGQVLAKASNTDYDTEWTDVDTSDIEFFDVNFTLAQGGAYYNSDKTPAQIVAAVTARQTVRGIFSVDDETEYSFHLSYRPSTFDGEYYTEDAVSFFLMDGRTVSCEGNRTVWPFDTVVGQYDTQLSPYSSNAVENRVITEALQNIQPDYSDIQAAVDDWLYNNIDPATGYVLDTSLSLSNAAAPANLVGALKQDSVKLLGAAGSLGITNFSDVQETGFISYASADVSNITDKPTDLTAGGVLVNLRGTAGGRNQILLSVRKMWIRNITSGGNAGNWVSLTSVDSTLTESGVPADAAAVGNLLGAAYIGFRGTMRQTRFVDITDPGYVSFTSSYIANITDKPDGLTAGGICVTYATTGLTRYQMVISTRGRLWIRNITSGGTAAEWFPLYSPYFPKWVAIGDSITEGTYSNIGGTQGVGRTVNNYANLVALYNGYNITNLGDGGMGFLAPGGNTNKNGKQMCDDADFTGADLVTIALGTNDWKHYTFGSINDLSSANTCAGAIKYCIEKVMERHPSCKLMLIGPMNQYRNTTSTWDTNWALNYNAGYGTLQDFIDLEKSICDSYGVEFLDMTKVAPINRQNIATLLGDGMHPTMDGYALIAKSVRKAIHI